MSFKNLLPFAFVVAALAACKAPSASTTSTTTTTQSGTASTITVDAQTAQEIYFPTWWVEQGYANKAGSPTVVVFDGTKILTRTQNFVELAEMGTLAVTSSGGDVTLDVSKYPDLKFGLGSDGKWNKQILFKDVTLVKGKQDVFINDIVDGNTKERRYKGTGTLTIDHDSSSTKKKWDYWATTQNMGSSISMVFAVAEITTNDKITAPGDPTVQDLEKQENRYFTVEVSRLGDHLIITQPKNPTTWPNYISRPMKLKGFFNRSTKELTLEGNNFFQYDLRVKDPAVSTRVHVYRETINSNKGGRGTLKPYQ